MQDYRLALHRGDCSDLGDRFVSIPDRDSDWLKVLSLPAAPIPQYTLVSIPDRDSDWLNAQYQLNAMGQYYVSIPDRDSDDKPWG